MNPKTVRLSVTVSEGMFPSEKVVRFETEAGEVSFFVVASAFDEVSGQARILGTLLEEDERHALVEIPTQGGSIVVKIARSNVSEAYGSHGDEPAREVIAQLAGMAAGVPRCLRCGCFSTVHEVDDEELRECTGCECTAFEAPR